MDRDGLVLRHERLGELRLPLLGPHQAANAAVALGILDSLSDAGVATAPEMAIQTGLAITRWPGRLELIEHGPQVILIDGAHNPDGMAVLAATVDALAGSLAGWASHAPARRHARQGGRRHAACRVRLGDVAHVTLHRHDRTGHRSCAARR